VTAQWLRRVGQGRFVARLAAIEMCVAVPAAAIAWRSGGWLATAWTIAVIRLAVPGAPQFVRIARHFGLSAAALAAGRLWRLALVALPASIAAALFLAVKPPRNGREWAIQLCIEVILFAIPAFVAWSLMDANKGDA